MRNSSRQCENCGATETYCKCIVSPVTGEDYEFTPLKWGPTYEEAMKNFKTNLRNVFEGFTTYEGLQTGDGRHPMFTDDQGDVLGEIDSMHIEDGCLVVRGKLNQDGVDFLNAWQNAKCEVEDLPLGGSLVIDDEVQAIRGEVRTVSETGGEKGVKLERYDLIPVRPLENLALRYGHGARKYDERNWERGYEFSKSYAAAQRHLNAFWRGEDEDEEMPGGHLSAAAFHIFALMEFLVTHPEFDDRPKEM